MTTITMKEGSPRWGNLLAQLTTKQADTAARRALNRAGDAARTAMKAPLKQQTGLKAGIINRALKVQRANYQVLAYRITVRGGDIRLKYFSPRETRSGVSANPFNARQRFAGTFLKGGRFPNRVALDRGNGQVFRRVGKERLPLRVVRSGVRLPDQVVQGAARQAFDTVGREKLIERMSHELNRLVQGNG
ncbi:MAG: hypothetical protein DI629_12170 [Mesorhizobium amorphae]|nr:MAG: hypothetical protein DI629_12170 [Mesorhizobium amorphae]